MSEIRYAELDWRWGILLGMAIRDGLLEAVAERPCSAEEVASDLGLDRRAVHAVLSALAELGILREEGRGMFRLGEEHRAPLLDDEHPGYSGGRVVHRFELIRSWSRVPEVLRSGAPVEDRTRPGFEGTGTVAQAMRGGAREGAEAVTQIVLPRLPRGGSILDVGGGPGANAESFSRAGARVTVFDRPEVIKAMGKYLGRAGIATEAGDMHRGLPEGPFDCIYFGNTSHMYGPEENRTLFGRMRRSLRAGGWIVIREFVRGMSQDAALFAINMLLLTPSGGTYSAEDYENWLCEAGFEEVEFVAIRGRTTHLILARNPG